MNIKKVKTAFKVAEVVLDKEHGIRHIKFIFLNNLTDENDKPLDKKVLRDNSGRIFLTFLGDFNFTAYYCDGISLENTINYHTS